MLAWFSRMCVRADHTHPTSQSEQGIALGNGWVDPHIQTKSYPEYAYHHSLIDGQGKAWLENELHECLKALHIKRGGEQVGIPVVHNPWIDWLCMYVFPPSIHPSTSTAPTYHTQNARSGDLESCHILEKTLDIAGRPNEFDVRLRIRECVQDPKPAQPRSIPPPSHPPANTHTGVDVSHLRRPARARRAAVGVAE